MPQSAYFTANPDPAAHARVFCLPHAGGGATGFAGWSAVAPPRLQVCPVQLPGRERRLREQAFNRIEPLIAELLPALGSWLDRPFALFGHSMGGLIAFELARALRDSGHEPRLLAVAGSNPPHCRESTDPIASLPDDGFLAELSNRYGGIPDEVLRHRELLELMLPMLRADVRLFESFALTPANPLSCPILCFGGTDDRSVRLDALAGWGQYTTAGTRTVELPGDHFFVKANGSAILSQIATTIGV